MFLFNNIGNLSVELGSFVILSLSFELAEVSWLDFVEVLHNFPPNFFLFLSPGY